MRWPDRAQRKRSLGWGLVERVGAPLSWDQQRMHKNTNVTLVSVSHLREKYYTAPHIQPATAMSCLAAHCTDRSRPDML